MKKKILIVTANYYEEISNSLEKGAITFFNDFNNKSNNFNLIYKKNFVPGCFEIPFVINKYQEEYDAFLALGCIIRGETYHFEIISNAVTRKLMDLTISLKKPIGFGILTCDNIEQAKIRSDTDKKNKGAEAAKACIDLLLLRFKHENNG